MRRFRCIVSTSVVFFGHLGPELGPFSQASKVSLPPSRRVSVICTFLDVHLYTFMTDLHKHVLKKPFMYTQYDICVHIYIYIYRGYTIVDSWLKLTRTRSLKDGHSFNCQLSISPNPLGQSRAPQLLALSLVLSEKNTWEWPARPMKPKSRKKSLGTQGETGNYQPYSLMEGPAPSSDISDLASLASETEQHFSKKDNRRRLQLFVARRIGNLLQALHRIYGSFSSWMPGIPDFANYSSRFRSQTNFFSSARLLRTSQWNWPNCLLRRKEVVDVMAVEDICWTTQMSFVHQEARDMFTYSVNGKISC